jgi:hypothetical protein
VLLSHFTPLHDAQIWHKQGRQWPVLRVVQSGFPCCSLGLGAGLDANSQTLQEDDPTPLLGTETARGILEIGKVLGCCELFLAFSSHRAIQANAAMYKGEENPWSQGPMTKKKPRLQDTKSLSLRLLHLSCRQTCSAAQCHPPSSLC